MMSPPSLVKDNSAFDFVDRFAGGLIKNIATNLKKKASKRHKSEKRPERKTRQKKIEH